MLTILLTLVTTSAAYTTYSPLHIDSNVNYHSLMPVISANFALGNGNGHKTGATYQFPIKFDAVVKLSDIVYQGHGSDIHRRVDGQHIYQRPHKHGNDQWNGRASATPTPFHNGNNKNSNTSDYVQEQNSWKQETIVDKMNENDRYNRPVDDRNISKQLNDVDNNQHITSNNYTRDNQDKDEISHNKDSHSVNLNNRTITVQIAVNNTNSNVNQGPLNPYHGSINNKTDKNTNNFTDINKMAVNTNNNRTYVDRSVNKDNKYGSKTTEDNEVTSTHEARVNSEDDRWIWSNGEAVETTTPIPLETTTNTPFKTTTLTPLDDRASFDGDACPTGQVKFKGKCIDID